MGFQICFLSNNNTKRVAPFAEALDAKFICNAGKPFRRGYERAGDILQVDREKILFIGDQVLTDIIGANRMGYYSILVGPVSRMEGFLIVAKRLLERASIFFYRRSRHYKGNRPDRSGYERNIPENYR